MHNTFPQRLEKQHAIPLAAKTADKFKFRPKRGLARSTRRRDQIRQLLDLFATYGIFPMKSMGDCCGTNEVFRYRSSLFHLAHAEFAERRCEIAEAAARAIEVRGGVSFTHQLAEQIA